VEINEKVLKLKVRAEEIKEQLAYWDEYPPVNNMGKWARQTKLDKLQKELAKIEQDISFHDTLYLSNEIYNQWKDTAAK
jgi:hypothetical protein